GRPSERLALSAKLSRSLTVSEIIELPVALRTASESGRAAPAPNATAAAATMAVNTTPADRELGSLGSRRLPRYRATGPSCFGTAPPHRPPGGGGSPPRRRGGGGEDGGPSDARTDTGRHGSEPVSTATSRVA